jgi:hypothetical protein
MTTRMYRRKNDKNRKVGGQCAQNELLMQNLMAFYSKDENLTKMVSIINGDSYISLRIIDWFVTNYAKKYFTSYLLPIYNTDPGVDVEYERFNIYINYKLNLKAYSKKNFDPFCRSVRIIVPYNKENNVETTVGQLNFFKWAIENKILEYIEENYDTIEDDMNTRNAVGNVGGGKQEENKTRKKRQELTLSACKCIKREMVNIKIKFM